MTAATRALLRLAARDARRDRGRSLLVLVIVALPVLGLVVAGTLADSGAPTAEENAVAALGRGDLALDLLGRDDAAVDDAAVEALLPPLPAGTTTEVVRTVAGSTSVDGVQVALQVRDTALDPRAVAAGQLDLVAGEAPTSADEVALSSALLDRAGAGLGDRLAIEPLGAVTVVGEARDPELLSSVFAVAAPGALEDATAARTQVLVDLPADVAAGDLDLGPTVAVDAPQTTGDPTFIGRSRDAILSERFGRSERWLLIIVGGLAAVEVALIAGAAFAVSVRRRQRELGLLAATGGTRRHVRRSVLLTGVAIGAAGAGIGVVLGVAISVASLPILPRVVDRVVDGPRLQPLWLVLAAAIGLGAAVAGAWWPARSVARLPVLTALAGRRPVPTPARGGLVKGLVLMVAGGLVCAVGAGARFGDLTPFVFLGGAVAVVLGAGLTSPWLLEQLGRTARFLPAGARLAVRDAARFRTRNGPIVTAAMAGLAATVTVGAITASIEAYEAAAYDPQLPEHVLEVESAGVPGAADAVAGAVGSSATSLLTPDAGVVVAGGGEEREHVPAGIADPELVRSLVGDAAAADLAAGHAVGLAPHAPPAVEVWRSSDERGEVTEQLVATLDVAAHPLEGSDVGYWRLPTVLLPADGAAPVLEEAGAQHLIVLDAPADAATLRSAARAAAEVGDEVSVVAEEGYRSSYATLRTVFTGVGAAAGLAIAAVAIALAAAESRDDLRTLTAVGAGRRTRRSLAAGRALLLAGLGGVLAVPVGLIPAAAMVTTVDGGIPLLVPAVTWLVPAVAVPVVATLGAVLLGGRDPDRLTRAA